MKLRTICLCVFAVVFFSLICLTAEMADIAEDRDIRMSEELKDIDPTDMSQYYAMGEYYPPDDVDTVNVEWHGGRVEIVAYNEDYYFVEESATRQLMESERLSYKLDGSCFTVLYNADESTFFDDVYKKVEIRIPSEMAQNLSSININTDGEVVLKNITAGSITVNGKKRDVSLKNTYSNDTRIYTTDGQANIFVTPENGYSVELHSRKGKLESYVDNGRNSYVSGDGTYPFYVKTKTGDLNVMIYNENEDY